MLPNQAFMLQLHTAFVASEFQRINDAWIHCFVHFYSVFWFACKSKINEVWLHFNAQNWVVMLNFMLRKLFSMSVFLGFLTLDSISLKECEKNRKKSCLFWPFTCSRATFFWLKFLKARWWEIFCGFCYKIDGSVQMHLHFA